MLRLSAAFSILTVCLTSFSSGPTAPSFTPEYFPFANRYPALQVDLNGDGIPDFIALTGSGVTELLSSGGGNYTTQTVSIAGSGYPIASGDLNNDGKADVIFFGFGNFEIGYGDGHGAFSSFRPITWTNSGSPNDLRTQMADFNGDGKPDLAIAFDTPDGPNGGATFQVAAFINNGNGFNDALIAFNRQVPNGANVGFQYTTPLDLVLGDFDSDGHADLVLRTTESDPNNPANAVITITVLFGNGGGGFSPKVVTTSNDLFVISAADMNNDGASDIAAISFNTMFVFYGHTNRTFTTTNLAPANVRGINAMLADFNGDKRKDIVYPALSPDNSSNIGVRTLLQTSSGTFRQLGFETVDAYMGGSGQVPFSQTSVGDYNRDGKPDVALFSNDTVEHPQSADVLLNTRARPNGSCQVPAPVGIHVCSPSANSTVQNPVNFAFSATSFYPVRKMEVWIDGKKRSEKYEVFANEGFSNLKLTLAPGTHHVGLFAGGFDGTVQNTSYDINVK